MKKIKSKYIKALAILLSMALLMSGLPTPIYAEEVATPTDTVEMLEAVETPIEETDEQPVELPPEEPEQAEEEPLPPDEPEQPVEAPDEEPEEPAEPPVELPAEDEPVYEPELLVEESPDEPAEETPDEPIQEDQPAEELIPEDAPVEDQEQGGEEPPADNDDPIVEDDPEMDLPVEELPENEILIEDEPTEPVPEDEPVEETMTDVHPVKAAIDAYGYAYLMTDHSIQAFSAADMWEHCFTIEPDGILLVTDFIEQDGLKILEVQFLAPNGELILAYVYADDLSETLLTGADIDVAALTTNFALVFVGDGKVAVFAVEGMAPGEVVDDVPVEVIPDEPEQPEEPEKPAEDLPEQPDQTEQPDLPSEETPVEPDEPLEQPEVEVPPADDPLLEEIPPFEDEPQMELPVEKFTPASEGAFVLVTTDTRAFLDVDDSAADDYEGDLSLGVFVRDAAVQIESVEQDSLGRYWYRVCYMYGDTDADGDLKWTECDSIYVLAEETWETDAQDFDATDFAFPYTPKAMNTFSLRATPMYGFSLREISMYTGNFYVGQTGLYGDSGKDSEYLQIATLPGYGKIYATPHYLEGYTVYCLEHLLPGPGERASGGGYQPTGPYTIVDLASYMDTPGYSGVMYKESTMHAIGWVLRHTVPFMELDESYSDNRTWSRVAGQFAIREVIKQLEGSRYVRDYWEMDDFYAASDNAPSVYLEYARWLAENGIARAYMTGDVYVSNKSVTTSGGMTVGTVTLTTDADLIRISKSYGRVTGHTYGEDSSYYYLNSGDTITISSSASSFSFKAESVSSPDEEAGFVVGVPYEAIQKLLIPIEGLPYPIKSVTVSFDIPYGSVSVTKTDFNTGKVLAGATFDLISGSTVIQSMTTGADGVVTFTNVPPGTYTIRERTAPEGYTLGSVNVQTVNVSNGQTSRVTFANEKITARIKIVKKDSLTGDKLAGAAFKITRLSGPAVVSGMAIGESITIVTDVNGTIETGWLEWGRYRIEETAAPEDFILSGYSTEINAYENGKTYSFEVENEPMSGFIQLEKTDRMTGQPIAGVQFDIYDTFGELAGTMTTNDDGIAISPPLRRGDYSVVEHENPTGYVHELVELSATVLSDETTYLIADNQPIQGRIRIAKKDQLTGDLLAGAEFTITHVSGIPAHNGTGNGEVVAVITTNENGIAETPLLTYGTYRITETKAPDHFVLADFSTDVTIAEDNMQPIEVVVENEPTKGHIRLTKTDSLAGTPIAGVQFDIFDAAGELAGTMTTDENGVAVSPALTKGSYTVREHENPTGYVAALAEIPAVSYSDETTDLAVTNDPIQGKIRIVKKDQLTGDLLAGAEFTITRVSGIPAHNGAGNGEVVAVITTNENGIAETPLLTYGTYQIKETVVPEHFVDNGFSVEVTISDDNLKTYEVVVENEPAKGWLKLTKTNSLDGHPIAGVTFNVYYYDDYGSGLACTMTTDENGVAVSPALRKGRYLVQEDDEPVGYVHDLAELTAIVNPDETTELSVTNEPIQGILRIRKLDELTGEALAGAEFTITRISGLPSHNGEGDGEVVAVITTDANGIAVTPLLPYGVYQVAETKVPPHFVDNDFSTEMVINEENFCTYEIDVENEPTKGWLRLTKTDRENGNPIAGVVFDVYYADQYGQRLATTMVTDANGVAMSEPLRKGQYTVQERGATEGYVFEQILLDATLHSDETTELTATNQPVLVQLKLYKRDADEYSGNPADAPGTRGDGVLTGAEFQVLAAEDITDRQGNVIHAKGDVVIESIKTAGTDASVTTDNLWPGLYQVVELTPPTGYQPSDKPITIDTRNAAKQSEEAIITYEGVITNEIKYGAQAIVKLLGDGTAAADPTRVETPEPGAEFRVYLQKAGSYDNARDIERDYLVTDANGYAMTKALPYGVYVLEQVKGKEGYEIKGPITFEIDGTESLVNPPPLTLSDQPILYRLKFIKTDSETGKVITLSNASFKLKDANGEYVKQTVYYPREQVIDTFTTDETGSVTLPETVTWGLYFVEEVKAPEGYLIRTDTLSVFVGHEGDLPGQTYELEIEIPNDPVMGRILLDKKGLQLTDVKITTDAWGNEVHTPVYEMGYLSDAVFEIRAAEAITGKDGTVWYQADELVDTITTTANGGDASKVLPLGKYNVTEVSAPEGYFFTDRAYVVELKYRDDQTALVEVRIQAQNDFLPAEISLFKEKETINIVTSGKDGVKSILTDEAGEGFVFGLFTAEDMPYAYGTLMADTLVVTGTTDKNGMLTLNGTFPHGDYYIRELTAPDGWKITADRFDLSITPDRKAADENVLRVLMVDAIHNELIHTKVTLTKTDITGEKTLPGAIIEVYNESGKIIYRDTTDEWGRIANIPVTPGRYTFREVYAPDGFSLNDVTMSFTVSEDGIVTGDTTIRDDYTRFSIEKLDESENPLAGVEFSLVAANGTAIMTARTNREGIATFEKVPFGTYRVVETKPLAGYLPAETDVEITLDGAFINPEQPIATIINVPNEIVIRKVDQDGKPLAGASFGLFDAFGERFAVAESDENGMVRFAKVPYGSYTIRELSAPDGYLASREEITVTIDADYRSSDKPIATVKNHFKRVQFIKVDTSGKYLPGVEFSLINAVTHEVVETAVSNDKGEFIFTKFDYGDWIIRETEAPEGYNRMEDYLLHVDESWTEPKPITLINIPDTYMFFKSDNKKNALAGATFAVEDENGNVVQEVVSAENGVVTISGLTPGKYSIREIATVEGFTVSDDTIEVVIDEKYEVPTKLKRFVNYPSISTGVDVSPTTMTWIGLGLAGVAGIIVMVGMKKKPAPRHARKRK